MSGHRRAELQTTRHPTQATGSAQSPANQSPRKRIKPMFGSSLQTPE